MLRPLQVNGHSHYPLYLILEPHTNKKSARINKRLIINSVYLRFQLFFTRTPGPIFNRNESLFMSFFSFVTTHIVKPAITHTIDLLVFSFTSFVFLLNLKISFEIEASINMGITNFRY